MAPSEHYPVVLPACSVEWLYIGSKGHAGLCGSSWVTKDEFYAGLAAAQAMPGPLFNFAAYLGECWRPFVHGYVGVWAGRQQSRLFCRASCLLCGRAALPTSHRTMASSAADAVGPLITPKSVTDSSLR